MVIARRALLEERRADFSAFSYLRTQEYLVSEMIFSVGLNTAVPTTYMS